MAHPALKDNRIERAEELATILEQMMGEFIKRYVHMSTNDKPLQELHGKLVDALANSIR